MTSPDDPGRAIGLLAAKQDDVVDHIHGGVRGKLGDVVGVRVAVEHFSDVEGLAQVCLLVGHIRAAQYDVKG